MRHIDTCSFDLPVYLFITNCVSLACKQEQKGYEELRKLCRQGNEFCREVSAIFNERYVVLSTCKGENSKQL